MDGIIYRATNLVNGKCYIGKTTQGIDKRWNGHCLCKGESAIENAIRKYGRDRFKVEHVDSAATRDELNEKEKAWICRLNSLAPNGYNLRTGGDGGPHSERTLKKLRKTLGSPEYRKKASERKTAFWSNPENKKRMLTASFSDVAIKKRNAALKEVWNKPGYREKMRAARAHRYDDAFKQKVSVWTKRAWDDPVQRAIRVDDIRFRSNTSEERKRRSELRKLEWADQGHRVRHAAAMAEVRSRRGYRDKLSNGMKAKCADKAWLASRAEKISAGWLRRKLLKTGSVVWC